MPAPRPVPRCTDPDVLAAACAVVQRSAATMLQSRRRDDPPAPAPWGAPTPAPRYTGANAVSRRSD